MKFLVCFIIYISASLSLSAQQFSDHYYTRKALFENTANTKGEIIFLGNSITEGGDWKSLFPNTNVINRGISGDVTMGIINRLDEVVDSKPKKIFLLIGVNDLARGKTIAFIAENCNEIIKTIRSTSKNTKVYLQSVLPVNPSVGHKFSGHKNKQAAIIKLNKRLEALAKLHDVSFINLYNRFKNTKGELKAKYTHDGLHLSAKGYLRWKSIIKKQVTKH